MFLSRGQKAEMFEGAMKKSGHGLLAFQRYRTGLSRVNYCFFGEGAAAVRRKYRFLIVIGIFYIVAGAGINGEGDGEISVGMIHGAASPLRPLYLHAAECGLRE